MKTTGINKTVYRSDVISALDSFTSVRNVLAWEMFQDGQVRNYDGVIGDLKRLYPNIDFDSVIENVDPEGIAADENAIYALVDNIINKLIESGIYSSFLLTYNAPANLIYTDSSSLFSCEFAEYNKMIEEYNEIFTELSKATQNSKISNHSSSDGVSVTEYENGTSVIVNFNENEVSYNGNVIEKQSWKIVNGKAVQ